MDVGTCRTDRGMEVRCRRRDIEVWRSGALEACCTCSDEEAQRFGVLKMRCSRRDIEVWRSGILEARCRRVDVEM